VADVLASSRDAESQAAEELLETFGTDGFAENQTVATVSNVESDAGVTTAAIVDTEALVASGAPAEVAVEAPGGKTVTASISSEALSQVGGNALVLITVINESLVGSFQPAASEDEPVEEQTRLASTPISIRLVDEDGREISIENLEEPIEVSLSVENKTEDMVCGWFDEETLEWRTDLIELVDASGDNFICASTHLTVFGAVIKGVVSTFRCSNAELLTPKGLKGLLEDEWWYQPGAALLWALVAFELGLMFYIGHRSEIQRRLRGWSDEYLLTASVAFDRKAESTASKVLKRNKTLISNTGHELPEEKKEPPLYTPAGLADWLTLKVAQMAVASQQGVNEEDLSAILRGGLTKRLLERLAKTDAWQDDEDDEMDNMKSLHMVAHVSKASHRSVPSSASSHISHFTRQTLQTLNLKNVPVLKDVGNLARDTLTDFMSKTFVQRTWVLFMAGNAWISLGQFSFTVPPTFRTLLLSMRVHGSLFCSAFFFSIGAPSKDGGDDCDPVGFWQNVLRNVVISVFAILVGSVPFVIMAAASSRSFVYRQSWESQEKKRYLRKMHYWGRALWCVGVVYVSFCTFFVAVFLANVGKGSTTDWVTVATVDLVMSIIVEPFGKALVLAVLLSAATFLRPDQVREKINDMQTTFEELIERGKTNDDNDEDGGDQKLRSAGAPPMSPPLMSATHGSLPGVPDSPIVPGFMSQVPLPPLPAGTDAGDSPRTRMRIEAHAWMDEELDVPREPPPGVFSLAAPPFPSQQSAASRTRPSQRPAAIFAALQAPPAPDSEEDNVDGLTGSQKIVLEAMRSPLRRPQAAVAPEDAWPDDDPMTGQESHNGAPTSEAGVASATVLSVWPPDVLDTDEANFLRAERPTPRSADEVSSASLSIDIPQHIEQLD